MGTDLFEKYREQTELAALLDKSPFYVVINELAKQCEMLSQEYDKEKKYKLADCFKKDVDKIRLFIKAEL